MLPLSSQFSHRESATMFHSTCFIRPFSTTFNVLLTVSALTLTSTHAPLSHAQPGEIRVMQILDRAGVNADLSRDYFVGAKLWFDQLNGQGGVAGKRVRLVTTDTSGEPAEMERAAVTAASSGADVLFGMVSDDAVARIAANPAFRKTGVPLFAPVTGFAVNSEQSNVFPVRATYQTEINKMFDYALTLGFTKIAVLVSKDESMQKMRALFTEIAVERRVVLGAVEELDVDATDKDIDAAVARLKRAAPQAVMVAGDALLLGRFSTAIRKLSTGILIMGTSQVNHRAIMELAPKAMNGGMMLTQAVPAPNQGKSKLVREYIAAVRAGLEEQPNHASLEGYIAARALTEVLRTSRARNASEISAALRNTTSLDMEGVVLQVGQNRQKYRNYTDLALVRANGAVVH